MPYKILPSILSADMTRLGDEVDAAMRAGADLIHLDAMDNHYVPNLTYGPHLCRSLRQRFNTLPIDVHLMASPVDDLIRQFAEAGATRLSIHPDATIHLDRSLQLIKEYGCEVGLVLNPCTPIDCIDWCIDHLNFLLVMTVNPGFSGQKLIPQMIKKIAAIHARYPSVPICVDGGVTIANIASLAAAGATQFVAGSAFFNSNDYAQTLFAMRQQLIDSF